MGPLQRGRQVQPKKEWCRNSLLQGQLFRKIRMSYPRTKVWVWFKGGLDGGEWRGGFYATENADHKEAVTLQHSDFKDCVVTAWRISDK